MDDFRGDNTVVVWRSMHFCHIEFHLTYAPQGHALGRHNGTFAASREAHVQHVVFRFRRRNFPYSRYNQSMARHLQDDTQGMREMQRLLSSLPHLTSITVESQPDPRQQMDPIVGGSMELWDSTIARRVTCSYARDKAKDARLAHARGARTVDVGPVSPFWYLLEYQNEWGLWANTFPL